MVKKLYLKAIKTIKPPSDFEISKEALRYRNNSI